VALVVGAGELHGVEALEALNLSSLSAGVCVDAVADAPVQQEVVALARVGARVCGGDGVCA